MSSMEAAAQAPPIDYSLESWKIDPEILSPFARELWRAENDVPVVITEDRSLRPKILDACGMTCWFCHNEGTPVLSEVGRTPENTLGRVSIYSATNGVNFLPGRMGPDTDFITALSKLQSVIGLDELHLTGGEPTLHPKLPEIIRASKNLGLSVKMTSNGENPRILERCAEAGLDKVIFSVFGTTASDLSKVQHDKFKNSYLAQRKIDSLYQSIAEIAEHGIEAVANIVVPGFGHEARVTGIMDQFEHLSIRLLNSLADGEQSYAAIYEILASLGAKPLRTKLSAGSSNARIDYQIPDGSKVSFKQIRPARFDSVCAGCEIDAKGKCEEGFYGLRLYVDQNGKYLVGVCIQRMDLVMELDDFLASGLPAEISAFRAAEKESMVDFFKDRLEI
ncbi:MAG TPA: radical SAM protein [Candidatus Saccharimonadales bacterium]|nr:radical SAM protein [Candidatus Saccharimonadales bacterium]